MVAAIGKHLLELLLLCVSHWPGFRGFGPTRDISNWFRPGMQLLAWRNCFVSEGAFVMSLPIIEK
jgi:hypothetical protein